MLMVLLVSLELKNVTMLLSLALKTKMVLLPLLHITATASTYGAANDATNAGTPTVTSNGTLTDTTRTVGPEEVELTELQDMHEEAPKSRCSYKKCRHKQDIATVIPCGIDFVILGILVDSN